MRGVDNCCLLLTRSVAVNTRDTGTAFSLCQILYNPPTESIRLYESPLACVWILVFHKKRSSIHKYMHKFACLFGCHTSLNESAFVYRRLCSMSLWRESLLHPEAEHCWLQTYYCSVYALAFIVLWTTVRNKCWRWRPVVYQADCCRNRFYTFDRAQVVSRSAIPRSTRGIIDSNRLFVESMQNCSSKVNSGSSPVCVDR